MPSVNELAAAMPHRRGLAHPADQAAESELGRMGLRGDLAPELVLAGQEYARVWRAWMAVIGGPRSARLAGPAAGTVGKSFDCGGCLGLVGSERCICGERQSKYFAVRACLPVLWEAVVRRVTIDDAVCPSFTLPLLQLALQRLAAHFGLTKNKNRTSNNRSLPIAPVERC